MSIDYRIYINSDAWKLKRSAFLSSGKCRTKLCYICGTPRQRGFHVHHMTYENLGNEHFDDLALVCPDCHKEIHGLYDRKMAGYLKWKKGKPPDLKEVTKKARKLKRREISRIKNPAKEAKRLARKEQHREKVRLRRER